MSGSGMFVTGGKPAGMGRGLRSFIGKVTNNSGDQIGNPARLILVQTAAVPPIEEYAAWLETALSADPRSSPKVTAAKLRRAVIMMRGGSTIADVNRAVGCNLRSWVKRLPAGLAA